MSAYISYSLPITREQAQEVIDERSNGGWIEDTDGKLSPNGEWCLAELEAFVIRRRYDEEQKFTYQLLPPVAGVRLQQDPLFGYTSDLAAECVEAFLKEERKDHPRLDGVCASKGGRAWIDGYWHISQLESLCAHLRFIAGDGADGALETIALWQFWKVRETFPEPQSEEDVAAVDAFHPLILKMLTAGINPDVFPRVWQTFLYHQLKGWKLPRIVCAANEIIYRDQTGHVKKLIVTGARHCDHIMGGVTMALEARHGTLPGREAFVDEDQGFIDNFGNYWTRYEAWTIAEFHGQITERLGWLTGRLHSENLY
jgi:hypothetical protein